MMDIVERLKSPVRFAAETQEHAKLRHFHERHEAAAEITALRAENERLRAGMNDALRRNIVTDCHQILTAALIWKPNDKWCQCANRFVSSCVCTAALAPQEQNDG
jgi:hypothetical protein